MTDEHQRLVSVESQSEYNVTSGKAETRIFVKMYVDAVKKGLIADIGAERWQTLCVLSSFMNANGECYPTAPDSRCAKSQSGCGEQADQSAVRISMAGAAVSRKAEGAGPKTQRWDNARYTIMPISQLAIFDGDTEELT